MFVLRSAEFGCIPTDGRTPVAHLSRALERLQKGQKMALVIVALETVLKATNDRQRHTASGSGDAEPGL